MREPAGHGSAALHGRVAAARAADRGDRAERGLAVDARHRVGVAPGRSDAGPGHAGRGSDRQHRRDDRRRCDARGQQPAALHSAHDRRGSVAGGRPRDLLAVVRVRRQAQQAQAAQGARARHGAAGQHHRADLRHLQHAVRLGRGAPPDRGHRLRNQPGIPAGRAYRGRGPAARRRRERVHVPRIRPPALRGAGPAIPASPDRAVRDHQLPAHLGRAGRRRSRAVHRAGEAHHHQADLGLVAQRDAGLLRHGVVRGGGDQHLRAGTGRLPRRGIWAYPAPSRSSAAPG